MRPRQRALVSSAEIEIKYGAANNAASLWLRSSLGCFLVAVAAMLLFVAPGNVDLVTTPIAEDGDYAANSILITEAKSARLLVGNYSRVGFNHPGPALLYPQAASELLFHDVLALVPTPYNAHALAVVLLNALLLGVAAFVLREQGVGSLAILAFTALFFLYSRCLIADSPQLFVPGFLASTWMPYLYFLPFLLFVVSAAAVGAGSVSAFPAFILGGGLLVHGHVSFVLFVLVMAAGAMLPLAISRTRRQTFVDRIREHKRAPILAALLLAAFAAPILLHTLISWPGELSKYLSYSSDRPSTKLPDALGFIAFFWAPGFRVIGLTAAVLLGVLALRPLGSRLRDVADGFDSALALQCLLASTCLIVYAMKGIDDLTFRYTAIFYATVPLLVLWRVIAHFLERLDASVRTVTLCSLLLFALAIGLGMSPSSRNSYRGSHAVATTSSHVLGMVSAETPVLIDLGDSDQWPTATGVLVSLTRAGREACFVDPAWGFLVTRAMLCRNQALTKGQLLHFPSEAEKPGAKGPATPRISTGHQAVALSAPIELSGASGSLAQRGVYLGEGWSRREAWGVWTEQPVAHLKVAVAQCSTIACRLSLRVTPFLAPPTMTQTVDVYVGDRQVAVWKFSEAASSVESFTLPSDLVPVGGLVDLALRISSPQSPKALGVSNDNRKLGIGLMELRLDHQPSAEQK